MKFGFVTCVQLGLSCIEEIYRIGGKLDVLITLPDHKGKTKSGRIYLDDIANKYNTPLYKVNHINDSECINIINKYNLDWLFIIGWSQIASNEVLSAPNAGCIGMHPTLLPVGRGRAAIPWAIIKGLDRTGVTMFVMDEGVDTGGILGQIEIPIKSDTTATDLYNKVNDAHIELIREIFPHLKSGNYSIQIQDESQATYWEGRTPTDGQLSNSMTINEADSLIRATTHPYPGAYYIKDKEKLIIWKAKFSSFRSSPIDFKLKDGYLTPIDYTCVNNDL